LPIKDASGFDYVVTIVVNNGVYIRWKNGKGATAANTRVSIRCREQAVK
jgi:hypothetical protein